MEEEKDEAARTRAKREASLKETISAFDHRVHSLNKLTRKVHFASVSSSVDPKELEGLKFDYESLLEYISKYYERISDLSFGSPPQNVADVYACIDPDSCKGAGKLARINPEHLFCLKHVLIKTCFDSGRCLSV